MDLTSATHKWHGKAVTEALPSAAAVREAEREIGRESVEVHERICRLLFRSGLPWRMLPLAFAAGSIRCRPGSGGGPRSRPLVR